MTRKDKGFSLTELLVVVAIIAVLSAGLAPALIRYINKSRAAVDIQNARAIYDAFAGALNEGVIEMPDDLVLLIIVYKDGTNNGGVYAFKDGVSVSSGALGKYLIIQGQGYGSGNLSGRTYMNSRGQGAYKLFFEWLYKYGLPQDQLYIRQNAEGYILTFNGQGRCCYSVIQKGCKFNESLFKSQYISKYAGANAEKPSHGWQGDECYEFQWPKK